ncbi:acetyl-CoA carboxylase biotin carboxyl carrier protein [Gracilibacillus ureilyticus]|uniref:Biotin carboxyl carrier protein of acetyl-CoA carboxylase n=1 Tax=Gracilibacillus ureilyticus TaxID=531814 RepID=A0A1H9LXS3_9BACI|nr:acetyl-CoA carboxylase biotin carboxyl carrier protein [Gracilibacillus ureilyticus]SER16025.1 acetyl-CoA carboxylase biotin carboxyl carrier protein [Gracilibacillus ureilyticus]
MLSIKELETLIEKLDKSSIDEFTYEANGAKIKLKKNNAVVETVAKESVHKPVEIQPSPVEHNEVKTEEVSQEVPAQQDAVKDYDHEIVSPMVGTFYSSPSPDKPAFVQVGDTVNGDTVVCIVEAMKLFNEIEADVNGTITEILVENGELVEYGQPLFRIKSV